MGFVLAFINGREILRDFKERNDKEHLRKMILELLHRREMGEVTMV